MRKISLCRILLFAFLLSPGVVFAQEKKLNHLTISYPSISGAQAVLWIAKEMGIFKKNGLDVDLVYIGGGPRSMAALLSGQLQIIGTGGNSLVAAESQWRQGRGAYRHHLQYISVFLDDPRHAQRAKRS